MQMGCHLAFEEVTSILNSILGTEVSKLGVRGVSLGVRERAGGKESEPSVNPSITLFDKSTNFLKCLKGYLNYLLLSKRKSLMTQIYLFVVE